MGSVKRRLGANVAALAELGKKAVAVDTDVGLRNLDIVMGLENRLSLIWSMWSRDAAVCRRPSFATNGSYTCCQPRKRATRAPSAPMR